MAGQGYASWQIALQREDWSRVAPLLDLLELEVCVIAPAAL